MPHSTPSSSAGPILFARGADKDVCRLAALMICPEDAAAPALTTMEGARPKPKLLAAIAGTSIWRYDFSVPATADAHYSVGESHYPIAASYSDDVHIAYVSCNGQEHGDTERDLDERNAMWRRLADQHEQAPYQLLLHGGDQLYADDVLNCHPQIRTWANAPADECGNIEFTDDMQDAAERFLFSRYMAMNAHPHVSRLSARVPSLMMWDDHDIIDGWGSRNETVLDSPVGRGIFNVARRMFGLFQMAASDEFPAAVCLDSERAHFGCMTQFPGFSIIAPDLRSERRPGRVMGDAGWEAWNAALERTSDTQRIFVMSSVPALGPRLSWVERFLRIVPRMQKYEDDLRDQWQSRAHRSEWQRFLKTLEYRVVNGGNALTLLSGEIHLATRGEMKLDGGRVIHQLVASGIAHPPPPTVYARALGTLARLGEDPLPGRPIRLRPLPGQRGIYTNQRNYLIISREDGTWRAAWELEQSGRTPILEL